ncbi:hypothetical protein WR25_05282 [Diploscapter pachys]|uniref:BPTI/Kunitz inhibitor domain-containing protein n=1 Tax=Diploscapter pachys TaxID=2018661 RepID=A0A2A2LCY5_9BILA|nr:hypothetical protein WR25_05282 [Diploscapter pachys]
MLICLLLVAPALAIDCSLPKDVGHTCDQQKSQKFYFDNRLKVCQPLYFQGCGGNENLFKTRDECLQACSEASSASPATSNFLASSSNDTIVAACNINTAAVVSDKAKTCNKGCDQGYTCKNNFCCPTKEYICSLPTLNGHESAVYKHYGRYTYSKDLKNCIRFSYFGNGGNFNNFRTFSDCKKFCVDSQ